MFKEEWLKREIFQTAFTHRSYLNESERTVQSNERLEFLGDSVLSLIISDKLYRLRPDDTEGDLTNLRSYIVKTSSLARAARKLNLGNYLKLSKGEELSGGRGNPQILANTFEALLGALFYDQGLGAAEAFIEDELLSMFGQELKSGPPKDSKSLLQEKVQDQFRESPKYKVLETLGPDHAKRFKVGVIIRGELMGEGVGLSKQIAEEEAASRALDQLGSK